MVRKGRKPKVSIGNQCQIKAYIPPDNLCRIADEQTSGILLFFLRTGSRWNDLCTLTRSAYMQGVHDMIEAQETLYKRGYRLGKGM